MYCAKLYFPFKDGGFCYNPHLDRFHRTSKAAIRVGEYCADKYNAEYEIINLGEKQ